MEEKPNKMSLRTLATAQAVAFVIGLVFLKIVLFDKGEHRAFWIGIVAWAFSEIAGFFVLSLTVKGKS